MTSLGNHLATNSPAYPTSRGYDAATGLGSPNIANLVNIWNTATPLFASTTTVSPNPTGIPSTGSTTLTATVTATGRGETSTAGPPPAGTVNFYLGSTSGTLLGTGTLTQACTGTAPGNLVCPPPTATLPVQGTSLATGANTIFAYFTGDAANDAPSTSSPISVVINALGGPVAAVSSPSLTFGNQNLGTTSSSQPIILSNTGGSTLTLGSIVASANFGQTNNCGGSIASGGSCTINVTFAPTATGTLTGALTITDNSGGVSGSTQTVTLTGTGTNAAASLSPTSLAFGSQVINTPSVAKTVTLTSSGTTNLNISSITFTGTNAGDFSATNNCPASLAPAAKCTITVTYTPNVLGAEAASLAVADNATNSPQAAALTGTGILPATLSPATLAFGNVGQNSPSATKTLAFYNNTAQTLSISSIAFTGNNYGDFSETDTCGTSVLAAKSCVITVTLKPSTLAAETAKLTVNNPSSNSPQAALTGTGVLEATVSPTALTFAAQTVGTTSGAMNVTLTNNLSTASPFSITFTGADPNDFAQTNTCGTSLAASSHCTISVTFTPGATLTRNATLNVNDSASNNPQQVGLTGTGR